MSDNKKIELCEKELAQVAGGGLDGVIPILYADGGTVILDGTLPGAAGDARPGITGGSGEDQLLVRGTPPVAQIPLDSDQKLK